MKMLLKLNNSHIEIQCPADMLKMPQMSCDGTIVYNFHTYTSMDTPVRNSISDIYHACVQASIYNPLFTMLL